MNYLVLDLIKLMDTTEMKSPLHPSLMDRVLLFPIFTFFTIFSNPIRYTIIAQGTLLAIAIFNVFF